MKQFATRYARVTAIGLGLGLVLSSSLTQAAPYRGTEVTTLQDKTVGRITGDFYLPSSLETILWGRLPSRKTPTVLSVPSGAIVTIDAVSHEGLLEDQGKDPIAYFGRHGVEPDDVLNEAVAIAGSDLKHDFDTDGPHVVTGPIHVEGAEPGDVLKVEVLALEPRVPYGVISNRHYKGALPGEFPEDTQRYKDASPLEPDKYGNISVFTPIEKIGDIWFGTLPAGDKTIRFPLAPFMGILGTAPDTEENWSSVPPARIGGNIDINELGVGATLYLPVEVPGASFYAGDPHFAQGDGEVALTALEGSLRAAIRLTVLKQGSIEIPKTNADNLISPFAETERFWIPIGLDEDLDEAMKKAVRESVSFLSRQLNLDRRTAYAYLSAAVDYEVSQVVDRTKGIHALVPKVDFAEYLSFQLDTGSKTLPVSIVDNVLYVPLNDTLSALGLKTKVSKGVMNIASPAGSVVLTRDSNRYVVNGQPSYLAVSPREVDGQLMLPVMVLGELMGVPVTWSTQGTTIVGRAQPL